MPAMAMDLVGAIAAGLGVGALIFAMTHASRKAGIEVPKWVLPAGIGLTMICYSIWNDYSWLGRAKEKLPENAELVLVGRDSFLWAPWTYIAPVAIRFAAVDPATVEKSSENIRAAEIMLVERRRPTVIVRQRFDCVAGRISVGGTDWQNARDDPAFAAVCAEEGQ